MWDGEGAEWIKQQQEVNEPLLAEIAERLARPRAGEEYESIKARAKAAAARGTWRDARLMP